MSVMQQIRAIEQRLAETVIRSGAAYDDEECSSVPTGWPSVDVAIGGGLIRGALHEWFGVAEGRHEATQARGPEGTEWQRGSAWTPPLIMLIHLVRQVLNDQTFMRYAAWIGQRCIPYGGALIGSDGDRRLLERSIFIMAERPDDRLWAVDLALRCSAIGVVVADGSRFDMVATRRIQLVAKAHQTPALLVRPPWDVHELSAAQTRWLVRTEEGTKARRRGGTEGQRQEGTEEWKNEANTLNPRWRVELLRCKGRQAGAVQPSDSGLRGWTLEWDRGQGVVRVLTPLAGATGDAGLSANDRRAVQA